MVSKVFLTLVFALALNLPAATTNQIAAAPVPQKAYPTYQTRTIEGWTVHVSDELLEKQSRDISRATNLLQRHLQGITNVVPKALAFLRTVPLWLSAEYPGQRIRAEYHPSGQWLEEHGRNPVMAKCVEMTNIRYFEQETRRMPVFVLHELAHAYHDQVLGNRNPEIRAAYQRALESKSYDAVKKNSGKTERAYALNNPQEYFAESTEAFFGENDFYPFNRADLLQHDPEMYRLLVRLWGVDEAALKKPALRKINYREPARQYRTNHLGGWSVMVEESLAANDPALAAQAQARLAAKLEVIRGFLPAPTLARLEQLPIYLLHGSQAPNGGADSGAQYFQKTAPQFHRDLDPRWADAVVIHSARNYAQLSELWSVKLLLHELAHAWHLGQWPEKQPDIYQAWGEAMRQGLYRRIKDDKGEILSHGYAAENQLEYFAELSCMYFCGCNYAPFTRAELQTYDPGGFAMIEKMWGISGAPRAQ